MKGVVILHRRPAFATPHVVTPGQCCPAGPLLAPHNLYALAGAWARDPASSGTHLQ